MSQMSHRPIRSLNSAVPAFAGALVACAYLVGAVVFSATSQAASASESAPEGRQQLSVDRLRDLSAISVADDLPLPVTVPDNPVVRPVATNPAAPRIAIVIDDVGLDPAAARRTVALDVPLSVAILPYADAAARISGEADAAGHDVLLHMPMEPVGLADPGPNALRVGLSDTDLAARMRWSLARVPDAVGVNNHMGSRFTADPRAMRVALEAIAEQDPLFLDSLTTGQSRGRAVAEGLGLRALQRDIFLDHVIDAGAISARLAEAEDLARTRGWSVVIGHPHGATLDVLENWIGAARERGVVFLTVTELSTQLSETAQPTADASAVQ
ncbi:divergent polysaccharide deacetylase family protein [Maricaulis sp.]|uniref:divergent polysaccharide deacetylase family protein n=1 Tax=Maricaulis sp. TaxID=1486257 RepID=UPI00262E5543|nr:divergent polysaccharide deacetylase family protein [Maricaulis sp.]